MSSYFQEDINYLKILQTITLLKKPKKIVEFGILNGDSLLHMSDACLKTTSIKAYDIFDKFNGNSANKDELINKFKKNKNIKINFGNYFTKYRQLKDNSIDILHIDIANDGKIYDFFIKHYFKKLKKNGIAILEGGSKERDEVQWMKKYNKIKISDTLMKIKAKNYNFINIGKMPSITIFLK